MDKHNSRSERGQRRMRSRVRCSARSPHARDGRLYQRHLGPLVACSAGPGWLTVEAA